MISTRKMLVLFVLPLMFHAAGAASHQIQMDSGWNMVSTPFQVSKSEITSSCEVSSGPWWWNPSKEEYEKASDLQPQRGYWVKTSESCTVDLEGESADVQPDFKPGWNMVSSAKDSITQTMVDASCIRESGPWAWASSTGVYDRVQEMKPTKGYWVKAGESCTVFDRDIRGEAEWRLYFLNGYDAFLDGKSVLEVEFPNLNVSGREVLLDPSTYTIEADLDFDGSFKPDKTLEIRNVEDGVIQDADPAEEYIGLESGAHRRIPFTDVPFNLRLTFNRPVTLQNNQGTWYYIPSGSSRNVTLGGCRERNTGEYFCDSFTGVNEARFRCRYTTYGFEVKDVSSGSVTVTDLGNEKDYTASMGSSRKVGTAYTFQPKNFGTSRGTDHADMVVTCQ